MLLASKYFLIQKHGLGVKPYLSSNFMEILFYTQVS